MEVKVGENFRVGRKIGAGSFGEIYLGISSSKRNVDDDIFFSNKNYRD